MFDQAQRSMWLEDQLWHRLRDTFPPLHALPTEVLITVGYPSSGARGRSSKIKPAEVNTQWVGNPNEKAFISIHPVYFDTVENAMKAVLFAAAKATGGARWGAAKCGIDKLDDGSLVATPDTQIKLDALRTEIGDPPAGFGMPFPVRTVQRSRLRKYVADVAKCPSGGIHSPHRVAADDAMFECSACHTTYHIE